MELAREGHDCPSKVALRDFLGLVAMEGIVDDNGTV